MEMRDAGALLDGLFNDAVRQLMASPVAQSHAVPSGQGDGAPVSDPEVSAAAEAGTVGAGAEVKGESEAKTEAEPAGVGEAEARASLGEEDGAQGPFSVEGEADKLAANALSLDSHPEEDGLRKLAPQDRGPCR